ncbi:MAG: TIGR01212 family radical SAM protein [Muribaculum sp.]|nr:TIGR01212 family radical SAM protein [Muribaculum sp.]
MTKPYRDYSDFLAEHFDGKIQKLSIDAGLSCPTRDGTIAFGGCTYCINRSFNPEYCRMSDSVAAQIEEGKKFFGRKYPNMRYLAYFQAYTSTHAPSHILAPMYEEALSQDGVVGLVVGTRPDCVPDELLDYLVALSKRHFVMIEYGAESSHDSTLMLVNRCHTWETVVDAVSRTAERGLHVGLHLILGLPGEDEEKMLTTVDRVSKLPIDVVKFHQLQLLRGTKILRQVNSGEIDVRRWSLDEYIDFCATIVKRINPRIAIDRFTSQSPDDLLEWPRWGIKNYQFVELLKKRLDHHLKENYPNMEVKQ